MAATQDNWTGDGYDAPAGQGGGIYLRLKEKGQKVRLRLVSAAYRYIDILQQGEDSKTLRKAAWVAIYKEQVAPGKVEKRVVVFQSSPMVYGLIKELDENEGWGDPQTYDIEVCRTEEQGKYYTVTPMAKPIPGPISDEDKALVAEADINLREACAPKSAALPASDPNAYDPHADE